VRPNCPPLSGTYSEPISRLYSFRSPSMPELANDPFLSSCYHLFPKLGIRESQRLGPDPFLPRARTRTSAPAGAPANRAAGRGACPIANRFEKSRLAMPTTDAVKLGMAVGRGAPVTKIGPHPGSRSLRTAYSQGSSNCAGPLQYSPETQVGSRQEPLAPKAVFLMSRGLVFDRSNRSLQSAPAAPRCGRVRRDTKGSGGE
jgi:hypothetical protein